jgi:hypothetical protein
VRRIAAALVLALPCHAGAQAWASTDSAMLAGAVGLSREIVDLFAGGGGASVGIERALGRSPDIAINHDKRSDLDAPGRTTPAPSTTSRTSGSADPQGARRRPRVGPHVALARLQALLQGQRRQAEEQEDPLPRLDRGVLGEAPGRPDA